MTRRTFLATPAALAAQPAPALRGVFIIMATPYTTTMEVDYEDLGREAAYLKRCGVHGMVWPQVASEYSRLTKEERLRGMQAIAAVRPRPALVFGIQGPDLEAALEYAAAAEKLDPDALISTPPSGAKTPDDAARYFAALAKTVHRPLIIQTTGGAKGLTIPIDVLASLAREHANLGWIKEEQEPVLERQRDLAARKPPIRGVFSGNAGRRMLFEMRLGLDGTMPGAAYADIYAQVWDLYQAGRRAESRDLFARLLLLIDLAQNVAGAIPYILKKRGVFKEALSRVQRSQPSGSEAAELDFYFEGLKPYLRT